MPSVLRAEKYRSVSDSAVLKLVLSVARVGWPLGCSRFFLSPGCRTCWTCVEPLSDHCRTPLSDTGREGEQGGVKGPLAEVGTPEAKVRDGRRHHKRACGRAACPGTA